MTVAVYVAVIVAVKEGVKEGVSVGVKLGVNVGVKLGVNVAVKLGVKLAVNVAVACATVSTAPFTGDPVTRIDRPAPSPVPVTSPFAATDAWYVPTAAPPAKSYVTT